MERLTICFDGQGRIIQSRELQSRLDAPDEWYARRPDQAGRFYLPRVARVELKNLREAGCDDAEIGSITGMSQSIIRRYLRFADQKRLAKAAQRRLEQHADPAQTVKSD
ncbi:MAG: hypothetical protein WBW37_06720 [Methyloceanibacter sp.]